MAKNINFGDEYELLYVLFTVDCLTKQATEFVAEFDLVFEPWPQAHVRCWADPLKPPLLSYPY